MLRRVSTRLIASAMGGAAAILITPTIAHAQVTLYDGSLGTGPGAQGWTAFVPSPTTETIGGGAATLDTFTNGSNTPQAGYSRQTAFALDRAAGFTVNFDAQLLNEAHANNDRAGFSVIVLGNDKKGIELGFWSDQVWAQADNPLFTHAESAAFDTTAIGTGAANTTRYALTFSGNQYRLFANGGPAPLLTGAVRDYTPFVGPIDPYETPNFLFFGDDTTSARGAFRLSRVSVAAASAPEPMTVSLLLCGGLILPAVIRKRKRSIRRK